MMKINEKGGDGPITLEDAGRGISLAAPGEKCCFQRQQAGRKERND